MISESKIFTRRDFLRTTAAGAAAVGVGGNILEGAPTGRASSVLIVRNQKALIDEYAVEPAVLKSMLADTLSRVTGEKTPKLAWLSLVKPTDVVGIVATDHLNPTHKELIEAVRESLREAGVPAGNIRNAQGNPRLADQCTALVSLPALKAHWLTGIGTVLKNYIVFSGKPDNYHEANNAHLGEIWNVPCVKGKTKLVLVDALRPLCDKGPQPDPRYMWGYKGLIAGKDPVAVESICLKIITEKRKALRGEPWPLSPPPLCVKAADEQYHLGTSDLQQIKIDLVGWSQDSLVG